MPDEKTYLFRSQTIVQVRIEKYLRGEGWSPADIESVEFPNGKSVLITKTSGQRVLARWVNPPPPPLRPGYVRIVSYPDNKASEKGVSMMQETEKREFELVGKIAAVIEQGDYTYDEAKSALFTLSSHYAREAQRFLNSANIMDIAQCRQRQFEKNAAALDESTAAEGQM